MFVLQTNQLAPSQPFATLVTENKAPCPVLPFVIKVIIGEAGWDTTCIRTTPYIF